MEHTTYLTVDTLLPLMIICLMLATVTHKHAAHYVGIEKLNKLDDIKKSSILKKVNRDRKKLKMKKVWKQVRDYVQDKSMDEAKAGSKIVKNEILKHL